MLARLTSEDRQEQGQGGFTLIELLVVIIIIGILLAIAIPSYLKFRDRANKSAAQANVRASIPAVEAYYADNNTYAGATLSYLQSTYDQGVKNIVVQSVSSHDVLHPEHSRCGDVEQGRPRRGHRHRRLLVHDEAAASKRALRRPLLRCLRFDQDRCRGRPIERLWKSRPDPHDLV